MSTTLQRRYDLDWVRVIAIILLLVYHVAIGFQYWGIMVGFITNNQPWGELWTPMTMLNIWRIPLLFFVSGMGVYFAIQNKSWKQLLKERAQRILIPFLFGIIIVVPIHVYLWQLYYEWELLYTPNPGHLWFLGNIFAYVLIFLPALVYLQRNENGKIVKLIKTVLSHPLGLVPIAIVFIAEALILKPTPYEMYAMTWHGFFLGLLAFFIGFCFVLSGETFWKMILTWRWLFLSIAITLFVLRYIELKTPIFLLVIESNCWIFSVFAFGYKYLNRPSKALDYLSQAAYPVYILHMIFLYAGSVLIFRLDIAAPIQFILLLVFTSLGCFATYELIIRRINILRPLFGLKLNQKQKLP